MKTEHMIARAASPARQRRTELDAHRRRFLFLAAALNYTLSAMKAASTLVIALKLVVSAAFIGLSCSRTSVSSSK
jgi:hypothetical protein